MKCCSFLRSSLRIVATILCASLLAPGARAEEPDRQVAPVIQEKSASAQAAPEVLTDQELEELAQRAEDPGEKVAGGSLSNQELTYIVIALAAAVIVLIVVAA